MSVSLEISRRDFNVRGWKVYLKIRILYFDAVTLPSPTELSDVINKYYLSSLPAEAVEKIGTYIRAHWGIENKLHWHLDVTFREDLCRARSIRSTEPQHDQEIGLSHCLTEERQAIHSKEIIHRGTQYRLSQRATQNLMRLLCSAIRRSMWSTTTHRRVVRRSHKANKRNWY